MAQYADTLNKQNWYQRCDEMGRTLNTSNTWDFLRALTVPGNSRAASSRRIHTLVHGHDPNTLFTHLGNKYLPSTTDTAPTRKVKYVGNPNLTLDSPFFESKLRAAIATSRKATAPGEDGITNKVLGNLDDDTLQPLLELYNAYWQTETLHQEWKTANVRFIPKPHKPLNLNNLRPISMTSCMGKLLERMVQKILQTYMEEQNLFPDTVFGFREHLSAQDILLQLKKQVIGRGNPCIRSEGSL